MFSTWGRLVYRHRRLVLVVMTVLLLAGGAFGLGLAGSLTQSGYDDPHSESTEAALIADQTFGRDHNSDVIVLYTAPDGLTVDDPAFSAKVTESLQHVQDEFPDQIDGITSYWTEKFGKNLLSTKDKQHAFASVRLTGETDTQTLDQYHDIKGSFALPGVNVQVSGLQPIGDAIGVGMDNDTHRAELIALPAVAVLLFFVFGGVVAALLPVVVGVLTIAGATGALWLLTHVMDVNTFAQPVVTLIGLGLAIDYALFIVSRYREELAEGYDVATAVRRSVATAGRTVVFSATMLVVAFSGLLMFPQGFLKSVAFGGLFAIAIAALTALTVLPALLGVLGPRVDSLSLPFLRKNKTNAQIEAGFWGRLADAVGRRPVWVAVPIIIVMLALIVPFKNVAFGGLSEKYLPPDNPTRVAQESFDEFFPAFRTNPVNIVITDATDQQVVDIAQAANEVPGFTGPFKVAQSSDSVTMLSAGLVDPDRPGGTIDALRAIPQPDGARVLVGGVPALTQDTIDALGDMLPWMILYIVITTTVLMFLAFGSLVLPIKAVLMSALGLGTTLGILTWIFIDGHGASLLNFTPGPLMAAVLVLLLAIIFGLSTDYEVFLISRMVEAREQGAGTKEAIRAGTAHTGRIITAAALILIVVTGAFGFSEIVMMKYIAYGMIAALIIDATIIRMLLVPSVMTLLGDDCWWAPRWMKRIQQRIGLGEVHLPQEEPSTIAVAAVPVGAAAPAGAAAGAAAAASTRPTAAIPRITADQTPPFAADQEPPADRPAPRTAAAPRGTDSRGTDTRGTDSRGADIRGTSASPGTTTDRGPAPRPASSPRQAPPRPAPARPAPGQEAAGADAAHAGGAARRGRTGLRPPRDARHPAPARHARAVPRPPGQCRAPGPGAPCATAAPLPVGGTAHGPAVAHPRAPLGHPRAALGHPCADAAQRQPCGPGTGPAARPPRCTRRAGARDGTVRAQHTRGRRGAHGRQASAPRRIRAGDGGGTAAPAPPIARMRT